VLPDGAGPAAFLAELRNQSSPVGTSGAQPHDPRQDAGPAAP
jgi:hypothetical protein